MHVLLFWCTSTLFGVCLHCPVYSASDGTLAASRSQGPLLVVGHFADGSSSGRRRPNIYETLERAISLFALLFESLLLKQKWFMCVNTVIWSNSLLSLKWIPQVVTLLAGPRCDRKYSWIANVTEYCCASSIKCKQSTSMFGKVTNMFRIWSCWTFCFYTVWNCSHVQLSFYQWYYEFIIWLTSKCALSANY